MLKNLFRRTEKNGCFKSLFRKTLKNGDFTVLNKVIKPYKLP